MFFKVTLQNALLKYTLWHISVVLMLISIMTVGRIISAKYIMYVKEDWFVVCIIGNKLKLELKSKCLPEYQQNKASTKAVS